MKSILPPEVRNLPVTERLELVEALWDSIAETADKLPLNDPQISELDRRLAEFDKDPNAGESWEAVKERILNRS